MSEMSYLEKLLDGVEVEWLPLGEITKYEQPTKYLVKAKDYHDTYTIPVLTAGKTFILGYTNETHGIYQASKAPVIIFDDFTTANKWVDFDFKAKSSAMKMVTSCDDNKTLLKYVYYWLNTLPSEFAEGDHKRQWISNYSQKKIPIPCPDTPEKSLAIQSEIVRILDKFTALTAELTAELTMRKKQYNYYREQLLCFDEAEVEWKTLGEIAAYSKSRISFDKLDKNNYVGVDNLLQNRAGKMQSNYVPTSGNLTEFREGDILIGNIRPYLKKIWQADSTGGTNGDVLVIRSCHKSILSRYLYQILADDNFFEYNMQHAKGAKMPRGNKDVIMKYRVPIPSFDEQTRIVTILDKFDRLTNSISEGLPREIELRQKQYEYYRDLLFSFPKPDSVTN
ncbi:MULTISPECIES: restriction endonuclease subunit S [Enterobacteriaceae]|uniref:Type I Restriction endonuclease S subunit n=1 Tax=Salmonella enterica subsp. enterica serovar Montevideo str. S5-403 TaxID=913242 RepID=G5QCM2_SALMO|nr:restriction endonuclease subunit S [Salmonella enterica subsp. enterica serovar Montevideo]EDB6855484.1 restriction endonuclease subunit S [Salmonella enterica subsp. enterica serovar Montevideo]EHC71307.1 Type I Restriction endonuclease S subunit [Salmonella enterica subsp. enterica serovar Montevideo str. S5-403]